MSTHQNGAMQDCEALPGGWVVTKLEPITTKVGSGATPRGGAESYYNSGIPLIRSMNVHFDGFKSEGLVFLDDTQAAALKQVTVEAGDVLLNITGASIGRVTNAPESMAGARVNQHVCIIRLVPELNPRYLAGYLSSPSVQEMIMGAEYGVTRQALTKGQILDFDIPLPPLAEQKRIVAKVEELLGRVNVARERLAKAPVILKRFRQAVLTAACTGRLTEDWREDHPREQDAINIVASLEESHAVAGGHKLGNAAQPTEEAHDLQAEDLPPRWSMTDLRTAVCPGRPITYGILKPGHDVADGILYVRVADFPNDRLNLATVRRTSREIEKAYARARLEPGDILLSIRGTVGRVCVVPQELQGANITQDTARLSIQSSMAAGFVMWVLRAAPTQKRMMRALKGVAVRGINIGDVRALQLPVPPLAEQHEIVRRVEALFALADKIEARVQSATARVEKITQAILAKAFRGELVPTEAELAREEGRDYEPASVLLERIRASRAQEEQAPRTRKPRQRAQPAAELQARPPDDPADDEPASPAPIDQTDRNEVMAVIREVFSTGRTRGRDEAIREISHALGYGRVGERIRDTVDDCLRTAVRRGILQNDGGCLSLLCRSVDQYSADHLIDTLLAAMGAAWMDQDDAIRAAAHNLGFRRAGPMIQSAFTSAIRTAIRRGRLERDGQQIRKAR